MSCTCRRPCYKFPYLPPSSHKLFAFCVHWIFIHQMPLMGNIPHYFWIIYDSWARSKSISFENGFGGSWRIKKSTKMICHGKRIPREKKNQIYSWGGRWKGSRVGDFKTHFLRHTLMSFRRCRRNSIWNRFFFSQIVTCQKVLARKYFRVPGDIVKCSRRVVRRFQFTLSAASWKWIFFFDCLRCNKFDKSTAF